MCSASISEDSPSQGLTDFFNYIWDRTEGFVYLPTLDRNNGEWKRVFFEWPKHERAVVQHVMAASAQGKDCYYSPALYKEVGNATKDNVKGSHVLWCEFDGDAPTNWDSAAHVGSPEDGEAGRGAARPLPGPSLRVQSSNDGHEHVYWRLNEFQENVQWIEDKNRSITYSKRADTSGWDATQILRPPFTTNYKRERPVTVITVSETSYPESQFAHLKPPPQIVSESIDVGDLPQIEPIIAKYRWDDEHFKLFMDPQVPEGSRSSALMRLGYFCIEAGMTDAEAYAIIEHADSRWGKYVKRNDRKRRLIDIINRARQKHPNPQTEVTFAGLLGTKVEEGTALTYGFKDFLATEVHVEWEIEDLLEKGGFGMVAAMPGVGKTQWSIQLGMSCALGVPFLGWDIKKPRKIVLLSLEMSHVGLKIFMQHIANEYDEHQQKQLQDNFIIVPMGSPIALDRPEGMQLVDTIMNEVQPDGIVIDSLGKLTMGELDEKTTRTLNAAFLRIRQKHDVFLWLIHHNRKASDGNKSPKDLSDVYGNMYITQDMSSVIILYPDKDKNNEVEVIPVKSRYSEMRRPFKVIRNENLHFSVKDQAPVQFNGLVEKKGPPASGIFKI